MKHPYQQLQIMINLALALIRVAVSHGMIVTSKGEAFIAEEFSAFSLNLHNTPANARGHRPHHLLAPQDPA